MTASFARMAGDVTAPFSRGADLLDLVLAPSTGAGPGGAVLVGGDFAEHRARFGVVPEPAFVVRALADVPEPTTLTFGYAVPAADGGERDGTVEVSVPAGTVAGASFCFVPPSGALLRTVRAAPPPVEGQVADLWRVTALLGNLARLLWVVGAEHDVLDQCLDDVRTLPRIGERTAGATLDRIGADLGVPRFPARPYGQEDGTVALYHLSDAPGAPVHDAWPLYTAAGTGHTGTATGGVRAGVPGRFGTGTRFAAPDAEITIGHDAALSTGAAASLTVECFVKPDAATGEGAVLSKHADPADATLPGWALSVGGFGRGIARNVRFRVGDGTAARDLFADRSLSTARFTHLAGVVDRAARQVRLVVDGEVVALAPLDAVPPSPELAGALSNTEPVRIGRTGTTAAHTFAGTIDEVRLSSVARTAFHPVLGESDDGYRRRLRIFQRWALPTRQGIQDALNDAVCKLGKVTDPFVVEDGDATLVHASHLLTVLPVAVPVGGTLDDTGRRGLREADVLGPPAEDPGFAAELLVDGGALPADFASGSRRMRVGTRAALRALLEQLAADGVTGTARVLAGFDPAAPDLRAVGRALVLSHPGLAPDVLAARAIRAGFGFVAHRPGEVYAAVRGTGTVEIIDGPDDDATAEHGFDLLAGQTVGLRLDPAPPPGAAVHWSVVPCGAGGAEFVGGRASQDILLRAERPGSLVVAVRVRHRGRVFTASRRLRIGLAELPAGAAIAASGRLGADVPGHDDPAFHPVHLVDAPSRFDRPTGAGPQTRRVHPALAARLAALVPLLPTGRPLLRSAWKPDDTGAAGAGLTVTLGRGTSAASLARLGALAHAAGVSHVVNTGSEVVLTQEPGSACPIEGPATVAEGGTAGLRVARAAPCGLALAAGLVWTVNGGTGSVSAVDPETGVVEACVKVGLAPGAVAAAPDGSRLLVADTGDTTLTVVTTADRAVAGRIALPAAPAAVAYHPDGSRAYAGLRSGEVAEVDPVAGTVRRVLALGSPVVALRCAPGGARLWVATEAGDLHGVTLPAFTSGQVVALDGTPGGLAVGTGRAYVTVPGAPSLQVVDLATASVAATFTDVGSRPTDVALAPSGAVLYVVDAERGRVHLRRADGAPGPPASLSLPGAVAGAADDARCHVVAAGDVADTVAILDAAGGSQLASWPLGTGLGERLVWSVRLTGGAEARLSGTTRPRTSVLGLRAGTVRVQAVWRRPDAPPPYTMRVALSEAVLLADDGPPVLTKEQYDLVMNVLHHLCPIGVEIDTRAIRAHVLELRAGLLDPYPPYTYPDFRAHGPRRPAWTFGLDTDPETERTPR
ncbi:hypothetical protein LO762_08365 [Actinocorallia sp. API 0066]|uniref:LamG-like jellyroll fold domain-containing protein n=1 Tax=Actinocorallia sp. API 0066 TaxID=2896846 RepID=UPI001E65BD0F|nr:LamG-like jellyroll fold domain-containing protein [Actinocorallia sp. API 0066]MCD0449200.1 hypothetical protein [Actinocorallia sp. API 0066]